MKKKQTILIIIFLILLTLCVITTIYLIKIRNNSTDSEKRKLVWSDEFNKPNGTGLDESKWVHEIGGEGWGNNEEQFYTDKLENCYIEDGNLVIEAIKEKIGNNPYTSARIITKDKFEFQYGKVEMRAKIPYGQGIWPAFWMLGADFKEVGWPDCGEIDIMENIGKEPNIIHGTVHGPGYYGSMGIGNTYSIEQNFTDDFHVFTIDWSEDKIEWFVDGVLYHTMNPDKTIGNEWVFNKKFFLLLNLAVGGNWPGYPDETTIFPQKFIIDYIRVYQ